MPIFKQLAEIIPEINENQLASGFKNISTWKVIAEKEQNKIDKEKKMKQMLIEAKAENPSEDGLKRKD